MVASSPVPERSPLHLIISEQLREQILTGRYAPGEQLPSEHQLMEQFEVSRITIRRVLANLASQGLVVAHQGKGVFVKEQRKINYRLSNQLVFFEEDMAQQGVTSSIQSLVFEQVRAPKEVREKLKLPAKHARVYLQKKLLLLDGVPAVFDVSYILPELGKRFAKELQAQMTFPVLEQNNIGIERIEATFECTQASQELSQHLQIPLGSPLLVYCYTAYSQDDQPVLFGWAPSCGDRLCYSVTLQRSLGA
ncbi:MAG TPA: GntR family transcriptional regulator [Synechococcales cyanobacterium M55_K2018_004]|nr:GntR family transcriptional regulator [Synechococcales cyanobacterium M55_K2018_004]